MERHVAIIGGGIAGLAAALALYDALGDDVTLTVLERGERLGGKLRTGTIDGRRVETGAETFLTREADDPTGAASAAVTLAHRVGLGSALIHPQAATAAIFAAGELRPMPGGTLMGVPGDVASWPGIGGAAHAVDTDYDDGGPVLAAGADVAVGPLVRRRFGDAVVDDLVDPLLGGVYAGRADNLSLAVTMPGLAQACGVEHTLQDAVRATLSRRAVTIAPAFATVAGGLSRLIAAIDVAMPAASVLLGRTVREIVPNGERWRVVHGSTRDAQAVDVDGVVLAVPSHPAARLLAPFAADAAESVGALDYASIGLVTMLLPAGALDGTSLDGRSGALIPAVAGHAIKAVTVFSTKWAGQADGTVILRASLGRHGDERVLQVDDHALIDLAHADLGKILGAPLSAPLRATVTRWGGGLPQYAPGHHDRVSTARAALPRTVALAGAAYDGIGIPICIRSGQRAADQLIGALYS
jgi:protoporphyrinogen/coproporphyrinogen III oxidase